jgi:hypothetical protein
MRLALLLLALAGCKTTYASATSHTTLGGGRHMVTVEGRKLTVGDVMSYTNQRAAELCPAGYDVVQQAGDSSTTYVMSGRTAVPVTTNSGATVIECRDAKRDAPTGPPSK